MEDAERKKMQCVLFWRRERRADKTKDYLFLPIIQVLGKAAAADEEEGRGGRGRGSERKKRKERRETEERKEISGSG